MDISVCQISSKKRLELEVVCKEARCNYHKIGDCYPFERIGPEGLCIAAYHNAYPFCLALLYGGRLSQGKHNGNKVYVRCPSPENYVVMEIFRTPLSLRMKILRMIKQVVNVIYPVGINRSRIMIKIVKRKGNCPLGHRAGDVFEFDLGNFQVTKNLILKLGYPEEVCPAAFDNIYPFLGAYLMKRKLPWTNKDFQSIVQCPDHKANVTFKIKTKQN